MNRTLFLQWLILGLAGICFCYTTKAVGQTDIVLTELATLADEYREASGLLSDGSSTGIWVHNDGVENILYHICAEDPTVFDASVTVNPPSLDWEDITQDDNGYVYIGDIGRWSQIPCGQGSNLAKRDTLRIYKITASDLTDGATITADVIHYTYPPQCNQTYSKGNAESLFYYNGFLYILSKDHWEDGCGDWQSGYTYLFRVSTVPNTENTPEEAVYLGSFQTQLDANEGVQFWQVTAADISPDGKTMAMLTQSRLWLFTCFTGDDFFSGNVHHINFLKEDGNPNSSQKEGLMFYNDHNLFISEDRCTGDSPLLYQLDIGELNYDISCRNECYELVWADEFNGSTLDTDIWSFNWGSGFWGGQIQYYTNNDPDNVQVFDGTLKIIAQEETYVSPGGGVFEYTSAALRSKYKADFTYGRIEARLKTPYGQGIWPAFWLSPTYHIYGAWPFSGEIDVLELLGHEPEIARFAIHCTDGPGTEFNTAYTLNNGDFAGGFHTYAVEWTPDRHIRWLVDDVVLADVTPADLDDNNPWWPFNIDYYLRLNVGVGGNWPGNPDATTIFPQVMEVDYVRVYQLGDDFCTACEDGIQNNDETGVDCGGSICNACQCESLINGNFEDGEESWTLREFEGAEGEWSVVNGEAVIDVTTLGTNNWHLALRQNDVLIENGKTYTISFNAYADANRNMSIIVQGAAQHHWAQVNLTPSVQHFEVNFTMFNPTDTDAHINFSVGNGSPTVYLDNISMKSDCEGVAVQLKVLLEGAYDTGLNQMTHDFESGLLPANQPFSDSPWNYAGTESVYYPHAVSPDMVDWILVEAREASDNHQIITQRAAILLTDGSVRDADGGGQLKLYGLNSGQAYYLSVKTRHHLGVMSSVAVNLPNNSVYDFSVPTNVMGGTEQLAALSGSTYGLYAGDFDHNGVITVHDYNLYQSQLAVVNQYTEADCTLDGHVTISDFNRYRPNAGRIGLEQLRY